MSQGRPTEGLPWVGSECRGVVFPWGRGLDAVPSSLLGPYGLCWVGPRPGNRLSGLTVSSSSTPPCDRVAWLSGVRRQAYEAMAAVAS